jgi:tetratricopeptide (TPR) repeat protein
MKAKLFVIGLFLFALAACTQRAKVPELVEGPSLELSAIDSLMWKQPDSAFAMLQEFMVSPKAKDLDEFHRHYCQLLFSELLYKNDWEQCNRKDLLKAVNYFDSLCLCKNVARNVSTIAFLDARAHYINGVGFYENNNMVEACAEYFKALEIMENFCWGKELVGKRAQFMALTNTRLTVLFSDLYLHEQAIYFDKAALACYNKFKAESWHVAWIFDEIGTQYDMMENYDTACYYYNKGLSILSDSSNLTYRDISTHLAYLSYKIGEDSKIVLNKMRNLTAQA